MYIYKNGFYYHYKHDVTGAFNNYAYEIVGLARHSEDKSYLVMYRPLYKADWLIPAQVVVRPLDIFNEAVLIDGVYKMRFVKIENTELCERLRAVRDSMYRE